MSDDVVARLAVNGVDVPGVRPVPLAGGLTAACFPSQGDEALGWWERLRALHPRTGIWPTPVPVPACGGIRLAEGGRARPNGWPRDSPLTRRSSGSGGTDGPWQERRWARNMTASRAGEAW